MINPIYKFLLSVDYQEYGYNPELTEMEPLYVIKDSSINSSGSVITDMNSDLYVFPVSDGMRINIIGSYNRFRQGYAMYFDVHLQKFMKGGGTSISDANFDLTVDVPDGCQIIVVSQRRDGNKAVLKASFKYTKPVYKDDLSLEYELETSQQFYRKKLSGNLTYTFDDYKFIMACDFSTVYYVTIIKSNDLGLSWEKYWSGKFMQTDCTISLDDMTVEVKPDVFDEYNDILAGLEKEYDLIPLTPEIESLTITKRPIIQVYLPGDDKISCFISGMSWEQDVLTAVDNRSDLKNKYWFYFTQLLKEIDLSAEGGALEDLGRNYVGNMQILDPDDATPVFYEGDLSHPYLNTYRLHIRYSEIGPLTNRVAIALVRTTDNMRLYYFKKDIVGSTPILDTLEFTLTPEEGSGMVGTLKGYMYSYSIYARLICDVETISGNTTQPIPTDDFVGNNKNYTHAIGYDVDIAYISNRYSDTPTEYGKTGWGQYFAPPVLITLAKMYPLGQSKWLNTSVWFSSSVWDSIFEKSGRKEYIVPDNFPLWSVIYVLLGQIAPGVTHLPTSEYSEFLYGTTNPITGTSNQTLLITPKSNIINGIYNTPAQKAPITFQQIMSMLANTYKLYWFIEDDKLRIEHILYFKNGGSYVLSPETVLDLTQIANKRNYKPIAFGQSSYKFDKPEMSSRYEFSWMDDCTKVFNGYPIEILSKYVEADKKEDITVSNFTSDIDYMLCNPDNISQDGFAIFAANLVDGQYKVPFVSLMFDNVISELQNGFLAFVNLQPTYWIYDLPARRARINEKEITVKGIERKKKQKVVFPIGQDDINPNGIIKTFVGNGQISKLSVNLSSRSAEAELKFNTEEI